MTKFKVPRIIPFEYSALDGLHCAGISDEKIKKALQAQRDDTFKDILRQVVEMLDGIENPYIGFEKKRYNCVYVYNRAIQTIKQAIKEVEE